jgi:alpha-tubulin suppressor-like RCC1 family protein
MIRTTALLLCTLGLLAGACFDFDKYSFPESGEPGDEMVSVASVRPLGERCQGSGDCESGHCVDGVCCQGACDQYCEACNVPGRVGTCAAVDSDAACPGSVCQPSTECLDYARSGETCAGRGQCRTELACQMVPKQTGTSCDAGRGQCDAASGECVVAGKKRLGDACASDSECVGSCATTVSGAKVCCDRACNGPCEGCGSDGHCGGDWPQDDTRCAVVDCPSDDMCRDYSPDIATQRCVAFSTCATDQQCTFDWLVPESECCVGLDCECTSGQMTTCGAQTTARGVCRDRTLTCSAGQWPESTCAATSQEICGNALDDDCDGETDEGCRRGFSAISVGVNFACGIATDGRVSCWGSGQGGDGSTLTASPVEVPGLANVRNVTAGNLRSCAVLSDNTASCWGQDLVSGAIQATPVRLNQLSNVTSVVSGAVSTCALLRTGTVSCNDPSNPAAFFGVDGISGAQSLDGALASGRHFCALQNGSVRCWGQNESGQLGVAFDVTAGNPVLAVAPEGLPSGTVQQVSAGDLHSCALLSGGEVFCWGDNTSAQLGDTNIGGTQLPPQLVANLPPAIAIDAGAFSTCAILEDRTVRCWGIAGSQARGTPFSLANVAQAASISVGFDSGCAVRTDGTARCFGNNRFGQLGNGQTDEREDAFLEPTTEIVP